MGPIFNRNFGPFPFNGTIFVLKLKIWEENQKTPLESFTDIWDSF